MRLQLLFHTIYYLTPVQLLSRIKNKFTRYRYENLDISHYINPICECIPNILNPETLRDGYFIFLNNPQKFISWNDTCNGMLWAYNLNYMDWLNQERLTSDEGAEWIDRFIDDIPTNQVGLEPYPIALRSMNWIKFFCKYSNCGTQIRLKALYSQLKLLEKKLEYHLLANHLLEDFFALYMGAVYFSDTELYHKTRKSLIKQLNEQILPDGAHFEQSPMYHSILLERLLDCINISYSTSADIECLSRYAIKMLGHLGAICYNDGTIPLLNDAAYNIAHAPKEIFDYAKRLGLEWTSIPMKECGYRKLISDNMEAVIDVGNITATYQPGHSHADTLNYELRIDGKPYVVDTGTSTYDKNTRRQFERSTVAHNCVSPEGKDSYEVWGGFRVGRRCRTELVEDSHNFIEACHNGFDKTCRRRYQLSEDGFVVDDWYDGEAVSYIHLAEGVDENRIHVEGATKLECKEYKYSTEFNRFHAGRVLEIHFIGHLRYIIR